MVDLRFPSAGDTKKADHRTGLPQGERPALVRPESTRRAFLTGIAVTPLAALAGCGPTKPVAAPQLVSEPGVVPMGSASPMMPVAGTRLEFGCDSSYSPITPQFMDDAILYLSGKRPLFWGRYFNHDSSYVRSRKLISYRPAEENPVLATYNCRLLPIFAQNRSGAPLASGRQDGWLNGKDYIENMGASALATQGPEYLMFLNIENGASFRVDYWMGWHEGLQRAAQQLGGNRFRLVPALYTNWGPRSDHVWRAVNMASQRGTPFGGAWVARVDTDLPGDACGAQVSWNGESHNSMGSTLPGPILASQYNLDCKLPAGEIDFSSINPDIDLQGQFLSKLFLPRR